MERGENGVVGRDVPIPSSVSILTDKERKGHENVIIRVVEIHARELQVRHYSANQDLDAVSTITIG